MGRSLPSLSRLSSREMACKCFERAYVSSSARTGDLNTLVDSSMLHCFLRRVALCSRSCISSRFQHNMRLLQFVEGGKQRVGVETKDGGEVVDLCAGDLSIPTDMKSFLEGGEEMMNKAQR